MAIVTQYRKDSDTTYVYSSESYYDPEKKQSRSRRKLIGKLDKETGEIIPTGKRGSRKKEIPVQESGDLSQMEERIREMEKEIGILQSRNSQLEKEIRDLRLEKEEMAQKNRKLAAIIDKIRELTA